MAGLWLTNMRWGGALNDEDEDQKVRSLAPLWSNFSRMEIGS